LLRTSEKANWRCCESPYYVNMLMHWMSSRSSYTLLTIVLTLISAGAISARTVEDYHNRIKQAVNSLDALTQRDETESSADYDSRFKETLASVAALLPETETVEWANTTFAVDNRWLRKDLEALGQVQPAARPEALLRVTERLQAIDERLGELGAGIKGQTKEESAAKLEQILKRSEYARNKAPESAISRLWRQLWEWVNSLLPKRQPMSPGRASVFTTVAQIMVVALALGVILYVIKLVAPRFLRRRGRPKKEKRKARIVLGETLAPDQSAGDLLADAEALARTGDLRAAIRKAYIALLLELGDRKIISLAQHKTNRDYLRSVLNLPPLYQDVKGLTESFERHWYGFAGATEDDWVAFRTGYKRAIKQSQTQVPI
jgi:hypothetical protein